MSKYDPLRDHLNGRGPSTTLAFEEIANLVGGLPDSARTYEAWWSNGDDSHVQSRSWGRAGYDAHPDLELRPAEWCTEPGERVASHVVTATA